MPLRQIPPPSMPAALPSDEQILVAARSLGVVGRAQATLWRELSDPEVDMRRLHRVIREDPGIAARVLKVANCAFYRRGGQVATIEQAIVVLGLDAVRGIAASAGLDRIAGRSEQGTAFVGHSIVVGSVAREAVGAAGLSIGGEAFLAGLLHDFGLLVEWRLIAQGVVDSDPPARHDSLRHTHYAKVVLDAWNIPAQVVAAVVAHHDQPPADGVVDSLTASVRLAHIAALAADATLDADGPLAADDEPSAADLAALGLNPESWREFLPDTAARARRLRVGIQS